MARTLTILVVEDDKTACDELAAAIQEHDDMVLLAATSSSIDAKERIIESMPDVVILDLELHEGKGNGLLLLQELQELNLSRTPYILVTTNNSNPLTFEAARRLGAGFILSKHQSDYSAQSVIEFLHMMKGVIHASAQQEPQAAQISSQEQRKKHIKKRILAELNCVGISPKLMGHAYLAEGIRLITEGETTLICTKLAQMYGKSEPSVERAMQSAIQKAWRTSDTDDLLRHYTAKISSEKGVPTLTEFMFFYAKKIQSEI